MKFIVICSMIGLLSVNAFAAAELTFDTTARPTSLILGDVDLFETNSSAGFFLEGTNGKETRLSVLSQSGDTITVSHSDGTPSFTFLINSYDNHVAMHLLDTAGIGTGLDYTLILRLYTQGATAYTLNDLMTAKGTELTWPYLWARPRGDGSRGSAVLYNNKLYGSELDAVLAEIWSTQAAEGHMVYPAIDSWTEADVLEWVDRWIDKFQRLSVISVHPEQSEKELYEMTNKYVIPSGANRVYMFSTSWRESGMTTPRPEIFPNGKEDMIAYREYLAKYGIQLHLKSLSPQIKEEKYLSSTFVDPRIMSWCHGTLEEEVNSNATTIRFRRGPELIVEMKEPEYFRLGNEVILVTSMTNTDEDVWTLEGCKRGQEGTTAKSHTAGTDMAGLVQSNNSFNFEEDFGMPNSLAEEICGQYGDFLNDVKTSHLHFDGTGRMNEPPWYVREFTDYVYSRVEYPTTGSIVGRGYLSAQFETKFSGAQEIYGMWAYHHMRIGIRLYEKDRKHTEISSSLLDLHFDIADGIMNGTRRIEMLGGQSGKKLSMREIDAYGLSDYSFKLFSYWQAVGPEFTDEDAAYVKKYMIKNGNHYKGPDVLVLSKNGNGDFIFTPHRVMGRTSGEDEPFTIDQEWGAVPRWQAIKAGTTMELENPYEAQQLQAMIWVKETSSTLQDPLITVNGTGTLSVDGEIKRAEYMHYEGGDSVKIFDKDWNLLRILPATATEFFANKGKLTVTIAAGSGTNTPDLKVQYITLGPAYVLEANKILKGEPEVEVDTTNLTLYRGKATQSSTDYDGDANLAIDGITNGRFYSGSVSHTSSNEQSPWWQVDFEADYPIGLINIFGRTDNCCASRLSDYTVYVISSAGDTTFTQNFTEYPFVTTGIISSTADTVMGQFIRIVLNKDNTALSLAEVQVYQYLEATGVELSPKNDTITIGNSKAVNLSMIPSGAIPMDVLWKSSDTSLATVDQTGLVTAINTGVVSIIATTVDSTFSDTCTVTLIPSANVTDVELPLEEVTLFVSNKKWLKVEVSPFNATNPGVVWASSDNRIASVDDDGWVTAIGAGVVTITVTALDGGYTDFCEITVMLPVINVTGIELSLDELTLFISDTVLLSALLSPTNATNQNVSWTSSDDTIASVDSNGLVTAIDTGVLTITVTTLDGSYTDECSVFVIPDSISTNYVYKDISGADLVLFPNPFSEKFILELPDNKPTQYSLFDSKGILVLSGITAGCRTNIDASKLSSGVYIILVDSKTKILYKAVK